jgi:hypothetical protein
LKRAALALATFGLLATTSPAHAHPLGFAVVSIHETTPREADVVVRVSGTESEPGRIDVTWPERCDEHVTRDEVIDEVRERRSHVRCTSALEGTTVHVEGPSRGLEVLTLTTLRGRVPMRRAVHALPADVALGDGETTATRVLAQSRLGALHFAGGLDHVLFVVGAFFLARKRGARAVAVAVTAFTIGHAITLALVTLGAWTVPTRPIEACIALSLVHVAREMRIEAPTLTRRAPAIACFLFGLVHGAGLASAMSDAGLRGVELGLAVASFNVGLELAEIALVALLFVVLRARLLSLTERAAPMVIGGIGAWLLLDRLL